MSFWTVWSKSKSSNWVVERTFGIKRFAQQMADAINKGTDRKAKVIPKGNKP